MKLECINCGDEFEHFNKMRRFCPKCHWLRSQNTEEQPKRRKGNPNQKLIDEVREASKLGLSYGQYKGRAI